MIGVNLYSVDDSATHLRLDTITSAVLTKATGRLALTQVVNGKPTVTILAGQEASDLFQALTKIKSGVFSAI
jgi:hypothetical protein